MIYVTNLFFFRFINILYDLYSYCLQDMCSYEINRFQKTSKSLYYHSFTNQLIIDQFLDILLLILIFSINRLL